MSCSQVSSDSTLAPKAEEGDWIGEFGGVKVLVDPQSATILNGVQIDFVESLQGSGFALHNPNAVRTCGCGSSFETESGQSAGEKTA